MLLRSDHLLVADHHLADLVAQAEEVAAELVALRLHLGGRGGNGLGHDCHGCSSDLTTSWWPTITLPISSRRRTKLLRNWSHFAFTSAGVAGTVSVMTAMDAPQI